MADADAQHPHEASMTPLGVNDLLDRYAAGTLPDQHEALDDHWYWCRHHKRAEHVGEIALALPVCIRVGPFMSEAEAWRLDQNHTHTHAALGMEVERI